MDDNRSKTWKTVNGMITDNAILRVDLVQILFVPGVQPTDAEIIERVRELQAYWEQMHLAGRRD